jgi:hypothetical protein|tara:strand:+ start:483 stop:1076 length:594 start_codon:yes stop_codon:yes gene_type:complete
MATLNPYTFNNTDRIGSDSTDQTQRNISNTQSSNYMLSDYFSKNLSDQHVKFAVQQPMMSFTSLANGNGIGGQVVDNESNLLLKTEQERALEKLQLFERPFKTVPYLGRGSCDPALESQLQQGEMMSEKKSVSTIMEKSFADYSLYPTDNKMEKQVSDASHTVEEAALDGWIRGGASTREMSTDESMKQNNRPNNMF